VRKLQQFVRVLVPTLYVFAILVYFFAYVDLH
jgi:hypothetical protein